VGFYHVAPGRESALRLTGDGDLFGGFALFIAPLLLEALDRKSVV